MQNGPYALRDESASVLASRYTSAAVMHVPTEPSGEASDSGPVRTGFHALPNGKTVQAPTPAGWYHVPVKGVLRWWDGSSWTDSVWFDNMFLRRRVSSLRRLRALGLGTMIWQTLLLLGAVVASFAFVPFVSRLGAAGTLAALGAWVLVGLTFGLWFITFVSQLQVRRRLTIAGVWWPGHERPESRQR